MAGERTDIAGLIERLEAATGPDGMTISEYEALRIVSGEDVSGWVSGAAMNVCLSWLKGRRYVDESYNITDRGRALLRTLETEQ